MLLSNILGLLAVSMSTATAFAVLGTQAGVDNSTGQRPLRVEINQFKYAGAAWDLYILALREFVAANQSEQLSYYQVAGKLSLLIRDFNTDAA